MFISCGFHSVVGLGHFLLQHGQNLITSGQGKLVRINGGCVININRSSGWRLSIHNMARERLDDEGTKVL